MPRPLRSEVFDPSESAIVHCIQRCVRRAFLAGVDRETGKDFSYRKEQIRRRMEALASVFGVDVLTYAVMSNHLHVILRNRPDVVAQWSDEEVAVRWLRVFPGRRLEDHLADPTDVEVAMLIQQKERLASIRLRLSDISWFMRALSEPIARRANKEDECTGHFWEGRFKSQRIVDEAGLLACAMYVDLNPVRAAIVESPDKSLHTSAYDRIKSQQGALIDSAAYELKAIPREEAAKLKMETPVAELKRIRAAKKKRGNGKRVRRDDWLAPLTLPKEQLSSDPQVHKQGVRASDRGFLNMKMEDYLNILRWTGGEASTSAMETVEEIPERVRRVLASFSIDARIWRKLVWEYKKYFGKSSCAGRPEAMVEDAKRRGRSWYRGQRSAAECFEIIG